jgi:hypothetical protein
MSSIRQHILLRDALALIAFVMARDWFLVLMIIALATYDFFREDMS